jgi:hypothetical protein
MALTGIAVSSTCDAPANGAPVSAGGRALRLLISAAVLVVGVVAAQAGDDASCLDSPTRACVLTMAVNAIEPVLAQKKPVDTDRML